MQQRAKIETLLHEETRTTIWFLWIFYTIYLVYDITYYYILPETPWGSGTRPGLNLFIYIIMLGLLPISISLMKRQYPWPIKYIYFIIFLSLNILNDLWMYWGMETTYSSGNVIEIVIVLFSPIFVNKRFFCFVSLGTIFKYAIVGIALLEPLVAFPIVIVVVLSLVAYILLNRFYGYVDAIKNSYDKQLEGIVKGIIAALELKDPYTRGHSDRVAGYAMILAKEAGNYKEFELNTFYYACLLHDIGKIHIPDAILIKPDRLTDEEMDIIKSHPVVGAEAVKEVEGIAEHIDVISHHHERWDGKGYPSQLKGKETPFLARVTAIADSFDAMTSTRSYRAALPLDEAFKRIIDGKGTQFDPELVDAFTKVYPEWVNFYYKQHHQAIDNQEKILQGG
ncbi:HD-GYP domain-containing protein [Oceanobacillus bengalensis]|uniref:HD-GYP domain-containing protein n=1 Tax=Oceanobacillus bengalensis TaxID=1435466 RepID=A0A494YZI7_9BACI|nr:HD-GYP domain-containing protein [Oceanobacillus bengalensis]RKQ15578.1 HD-GYP domain-containing protein [Oceanobacillus bengalensis]